MDNNTVIGAETSDRLLQINEDKANVLQNVSIQFVSMQARIQDFLKGGGGEAHPPLDIVRVTSSALQII